MQDAHGQSSIISKSSLRAPHSGQVQFGGTSSHRVPGGMPSSGAPRPHRRSSRRSGTCIFSSRSTSKGSGLHRFRETRARVDAWSRIRSVATSTHRPRRIEPRRVVMPADDDPGFPPVVLTFAASDPSGGAGMQADLLTLASMGCHPLSVVTALTVQDTLGVEGDHGDRRRLGRGPGARAARGHAGRRVQDRRARQRREHRRDRRDPLRLSRTSRWCSIRCSPRDAATSSRPTR